LKKKEGVYERMKAGEGRTQREEKLRECYLILSNMLGEEPTWSLEKGLEMLKERVEVTGERLATAIQVLEGQGKSPEVELMMDYLWTTVELLKRGGRR
jgi:hypothetical protein